MIDAIDQLESWGKKMEESIRWCHEHLEPNTWRYTSIGPIGQFDFDNDQDYLMFILRTE